MPTDVKTDPSTVEVEEAESTTVEEEESQEELDAKLPFHKHKRWQEVYGKAKEYEGLGSPDDIRAELEAGKTAVAKVAYYDQLIAEAETEREPDEPKTDEQKKLEARRKEAYKELKEIAPELEAIPVHSKALETHFSSLEILAWSETGKVMKAAGLPTADTDVSDMSQILAPIIKGDRELYAEYVVNPREAVKLAFGRFGTKFKAAAGRTSAATLQRDKAKLKSLPRVGKGGGTGEPEKEPGEPKNIREATARIRAKLEAME